MLNVAMISRWHVHAAGYAKMIQEAKDAKITCVWDEQPERGQAWAQELGVPFVADYGALLARKLHALDACVTVSARAPRDFARIEAAGMRWLDTRRLAGRLAGFDLVFNTVPAPVLGETELEELKPACVVIDLASLPGGIAPDLAAPPACRVLHALSLPGRVAPRSAARAIYDTVRAILQEEGIV